MMSEWVIWFWLAAELAAYLWPWLRDLAALYLGWRIARELRAWRRL